MASLGVPLPRLRPAVDDHGIHAREHRKFAKSESFQKLPMLVQVIAEKMIEYHDQLAAQQMQAIAQAQPQPSGKGGASQNPMRSGSSGARMAGDHEEMGRDMAGVA